MTKNVLFDNILLRKYGAYIRTDLSGQQEVSGTATGVIGVVGLAERGPVGERVTIEGYTQLVETFGDGPVVRHGLAMFIGGARRLICVRMGSPVAASAYIGDLNGPNGTARGYRVLAKEKGSFGKNISVSTVEIAQAPGKDPLIDVAIRYSDNRGLDLVENFVFPRHVPVPEATRYYTGSDSYFILRNRDTGFIREIPEAWTYGLNTQLDFTKKIADLKDFTEDVMEFPAHGTVDPLALVDFPLAIISSVINTGGIVAGRGYAGSAYVTITEVTNTLEFYIDNKIAFDDVASDHIIFHSAYNLSAPDNANGEDGTGYYNVVKNPTTGVVLSEGLPTYATQAGEAASRLEWTQALGLLEEADINFIQPAYLFNAKGVTTWASRYGYFKFVATLTLAHVIAQSSTDRRKYRMSILGLPYYRSIDNASKTAKDFLADIKDVNGLLNCDKIQLWAGGFKSSSFSNKAELYGADMLASFVAGLDAARSPADSLTFETVAGIFTDGLEFTFSSTQRDELYARSLAHLSVRTFNGADEIAVAHNLTSWTGSVSRGTPYVITQRIIQTMNSYIYQNLERTFIGKRSADIATTGKKITDFVEGLLRRLVADGLLVTFSNVRVTAVSNDRAVYEIAYDFQPVSEIDFILTTNRLIYSV